MAIYLGSSDWDKYFGGRLWDKYFGGRLCDCFSLFILSLLLARVDMVPRTRALDETLRELGSELFYRQSYEMKEAKYME